VSAELALRRALYALWRNDETVAGLIGGRVYDAIPTAAVFPYVQLGETQALDHDVGCGPTLEIYQDVHVWSRATGFPEAMNIMSALRASVRTAMADSAVTLDGLELQELRHEQSRMLRDPDGKTSHGVLTFMAFID
jgi:hypothetical protein